MFDNKRILPIIAVIGAMALMTSSPVLAQTATPDSSASASAAAAPVDSSAPAASGAADSSAPAPAEAAKAPEKLTPVTMFFNATLVVKAVITGLALASLFSWTRSAAPNRSATSTGSPPPRNSRAIRWPTWPRPRRRKSRFPARPA